MNREHLLGPNGVRTRGSSFAVARLAGLASFAAVGSMLLASPEASASPLTCEHRSAKHLDEHGGRAADDAWHVSHGQLPSCDASEGIEIHDNRDDDGGFNWPGRRDKLGPFR